jgi:flagella basal body P-ring formation protein FlgA
MFSNEFFLKGALILFSLLLPVDVWAEVPTKPIEVRIDAEVPVAGEAIVLGDVATIYSKSIHHFQALSGLTVASFPGTGNEVRIPRAYIESRIRETLPQKADFKLTAPEQVVFRLERLGVSPAMIGAELIRRGRAEGRIPAWAQVEVEAVSGFDRLQLWKPESVKVEPGSRMARWKGEMALKLSREGEADHSWVRVRVRWFADAWVARRQIGMLTNIAPEDFTAKRVEVTAMRDDPILASEDIKALLGSARARRSMQPGSALVAGSFERAPDIRPGQPLKVVFISESGIRVTTEGAVMGNGSVGDEVRARLRSSRRIVTGKLVSGGVMEVSL